MQLKSVLFLAMLPLLASACTSNPYNIPDPGPVTAIEEPADGKYTVTYRGAPGATVQKVRDLALLRASQITLQKGGNWFEIVTDYSRTQDEAKSAFELDPFSEIGDSQGDCGVLGCPSRARPDALGQRDIDPKATKQSYSIQSFEIIVNTGERPFYKENTYSALEISEEMRKKYSGSLK
jgi:hypothetical protein